MKIDTWEKAYNFLNDSLGVSNDALDLAFSLKGHNMRTAKSILYFYTGYRSYNRLLNDFDF